MRGKRVVKKSIAIGIILFIFISVACIFTVPYLVPLNQITVSASYDYGFNNRTGMFLLAFFSLIVVAASFFYKGQDKLYVDVFADNFQKIVFNKVFLIVASLTVIGCSILWFILGRDSYGMIESGYFIPRIYDITWGKTVYRDFDFAYGPLLLYIPYFIYKLFSFLRISISDGYMIALMINQLLGLYFLFYVLAFFNLTGKEKNRIFILIALISFPYSIGLNYTLFRFVTPFFCLVFLRKVEKDTKISPFIHIFLSVALSLTVLLISPELGISFYFTLLAYIGTAALLTKRKYYFLQAGVLACSLVVFVNVWSDMFNQVTGFLSGGLNWPFVLSSLLLFFFIAVFVVSAGIGMQLKNIKTYLFPLSFALLTFSLIPGALGRCDPGHVFFYGLFIFILAYSCLRIYLKLKCFRIMGIVFIISLLSVYPYIVKEYVPAYLSSMGKHLEKIDVVPHWIISMGKYLNIDVNEKLQQRKLRYIALEEEFADIDNITMPFVDSNYYIPLNIMKKYVSLFYLHPNYVGSKYAVDRHLKELKEKKPQYLLLPNKWDEISYPGNYRIINILFCTYYPVTPKRNGNILYEPFVDYVFSEYSYIKNIANYMLYKRNL
jgi:hypothetical protein